MDPGKQKMSWAKFDDRYDDNRKIKRAWKRDRASIGLHAMAITYCSRHNTDGAVDVDWIEDKLPNQRERDRTITVLVDAGLFEQIDAEHWLVHDYLDFNSSKRSREETSAAAREAARVRWAKTQEADRNANGNAKRIANRIAECNAVSDATPMLPPAQPSPAPSHKATASSDQSDVKQVFDAWIEATGRTGATVLSDKRRRLIRTALAAYSLADVLDAVRGWRKSPHHRGENPHGTIYNNLELLLRDAEHIERFRDLQREGNGNGGPPKLADLHAAQAAHNQRRNAA
jgi:hypothetical protein